MKRSGSLHNIGQQKDDVARFEKFWNVRVLVTRFAVQKVPAAESEYRRSGTKKREKKRCLDGLRMHRTARYARKNVRSVGKKKKAASPRQRE